MAKSTMTWVLAMVLMTSFGKIDGAVDASSTDKPKTADANTPCDPNQTLETDAKGSRTCPPPYTHVLGECFYVHMYIPLLTWQEAQTFCKQAGGVLAEPKHFGAVIAHLYNMDMADKVFRGIFNRVWVGGRRVGNSTTFEWSSGRTIEDTVTEGPDPIFFDENGDCVMMRMHKDGPFQLKANACDTKTHYACQLL